MIHPYWRYDMPEATVTMLSDGSFQIALIHQVAAKDLGDHVNALNRAYPSIIISFASDKAETPTRDGKTIPSDGQNPNGEAQAANLSIRQWVELVFDEWGDRWLPVGMITWLVQKRGYKGGGKSPQQAVSRGVKGLIKEGKLEVRGKHAGKKYRPSSAQRTIHQEIENKTDEPPGTKAIMT